MRLEDVVASIGAYADDSLLITEAAPLMEPGPRILWCNAAVSRQTGYAGEELIGRSPRMFQGPGTDAAELARIGAALREGRPVRADLLNYRKDGSSFWTDLSIIPVADAAGRTRFFFAAQRDITRRKTHEFGHRAALEALQRRAEREAEVSAQLEGLSRSGPGALHQVRVGRDGVWRLTYWSAALPQLFGLEPTAVSFDALRARTHPADAGRVEHALQGAQAAMAAISFDYRVRHPEKGERWLRSIAAPRTAPDGATLWDGHVIDVTDERRVMAELETARKRAEAASAAKSLFLARMSHELRTPLNAILGLAALMDRDGLPPAQAERLVAIRAGGEALLGVLADVLDVAEIEDAGAPPAPAAFSVAGLAQRLDAAHAAAAAARGLGFGVGVIARPGAARMGDEAQIVRIADKLIENALKFTEAGMVSVRLIDEVDALRIEVEDTGPGLADHDVARVFSAFSQGDEGPTRRHGGTGLGLTLADRLARAMGGRITVDSAPGRGSVFCARLPLPRAPGAPQAAASLRGLRALVVEDNLATRAQLAGLLAAAGIAVVEATDGAEALAAHAASRFDVVLLDLALPGIDGFETLRRLRAADAARGARPTTVVVVTASALAHEMRAQAACGFDGHVPKPIRREALLAEIARVAALAPADAG